MSISDRLLGKKNVNGKPHIDAVAPRFALPGGEVRIIGKSLRPQELRRPSVHFGELEGSVLISSDDFLVARVPDGAASGPVVVSTNVRTNGAGGNGHVSGKPHIDAVAPRFALPGGEVRIIGKSLRPQELRRPSVHFGELEGSVLISSDDTN